MNKPFTTDHLKWLWAAFKHNIPKKLSDFENDVYSEINPDWEQTDETKPDYIKRKPFGNFENVYIKIFDRKFVAEKVVSNNSGVCMRTIIYMTSGLLKSGKTYAVEIDGITYKDLSCDMISSGSQALYPHIGNDPSSFDTYPFCIFSISYPAISLEIRTPYKGQMYETIDIKIYEFMPSYKKTIGEEWLPNDLVNNKTFVATITESDTGEITCDKTYSEIFEAYEKGNRIIGKLVYPNYTGMLEFVMVSTAMVEFSCYDRQDNSFMSYSTYAYDASWYKNTHITIGSKYTLKTTDKTIVGAINEVKKAVPTVSDILNALPTWNGGAY